METITGEAFTVKLLKLLFTFGVLLWNPEQN